MVDDALERKHGQRHETQPLHALGIPIPGHDHGDVHALVPACELSQLQHQLAYLSYPDKVLLLILGVACEVSRDKYDSIVLARTPVLDGKERHESYAVASDRNPQ